MTGPARIAYKILTMPEMAELQDKGLFAGSPLDRSDGFIHMSAAAQVTETVDRYFAGQPDIAIVAVDLAGLGDAVKWEASRGGALFPHLYAPLPLTAVLAHGPLAREADGAVRLPA